MTYRPLHYCCERSREIYIDVMGEWSKTKLLLCLLVGVSAFVLIAVSLITADTC